MIQSPNNCLNCNNSSFFNSKLFKDFTKNKIFEELVLSKLFDILGFESFRQNCFPKPTSPPLQCIDVHTSRVEKAAEVF